MNRMDSLFRGNDMGCENDTYKAKIILPPPKEMALKEKNHFLLPRESLFYWGILLFDSSNP
jgi:hypothetical protein